MLRLFYLFLLSLLFPLLLRRFQTAKAASCFLSVSLSFFSPSLSSARACGRNFFQSGRFYVSLFNEDIKADYNVDNTRSPRQGGLTTWRTRE